MNKILSKSYKYRWSGIDLNHNIVGGVIYAYDDLEVRNILNQQNISVFQIKKDLVALVKDKFFHKKIIPYKLIADFMRQLAFMIKANMPLLVSLNVIIKDLSNKALQNILRVVIQDIESGCTLTYALSKQPKYFLPLWCNLIHIGEQTGNLPIILQYIAQHIFKSKQQSRKIIKAMLYPSVILTVALMVSILMLVFVMPRFKEMYLNFGGKLPAYTEFILSCSDLLKHYIVYWLFIGIGFITSVMYGYNKTIYWRKKIEYLLFNIPIIGNILHKHFSIIMAWTLYITTSSGMQLCEALTLCANNMANLHYRESILSMSKSISQGNSLYKAMLSQNLFSEKFLQLVVLGEESGNLSEMFLSLTNTYEEDVNYFIENLNNLLEPMLMLVLGLIVGGLIIGMYLPLFKLGSVM